MLLHEEGEQGMRAAKIASSATTVRTTSVNRPIRHQDLYVLLFTLILVALCVSLVSEVWPLGWTSSETSWTSSSSLESDQVSRISEDARRHVGLQFRETVMLSSSSNSDGPPTSISNPDCNFYNCFSVYRCGRIHQHRLSVYVYPVVRYSNPDRGSELSPLGPVSEEFLQVLDAVLESPYYTADPLSACLFVPAIDTLNQDRIDAKLVGQALASLPFWNGGENHLLFNMLPGSRPSYETIVEVPRGKALVAGGGFSSWSYRSGYDVSIPVFNPHVTTRTAASNHRHKQKWFVVSSQRNVRRAFKRVLKSLSEDNPNELLLLDRCDDGERPASNSSLRCRGNDIFSYPDVLQDSTFCLVLRGARLGQMVFFDAIMSGCIPVVVADTYVLPFSEVLDWKRASVSIYEDELSDLISILKSYSDERIAEMRSKVRWFWHRYFGSVKSIATTVLHILNDRIFSHVARSYEDWNDPPITRGPRTPLFLPMIAPKSQGFTAVVLTYDRLDSLFQVIQNVVKAPSLAKVLVVWNNQNKPPPHASIWPKINKPLKVVQTQANKLSNRFYPYDEIETEAILAIDDDIVMLTADELEFGFEAWREFPDRIVGFPSRVHLWDNTTGQWKYESEWTNEVSMVLTGVAFYHKFWSYMYTTTMPKEIKHWVDEHMNCEDIAMNFLVTNTTGKAPIKVAPRKKFKCPECTNTEMLSTDLSHMIERSKCVNKFAEVYGCMPLKPIEFRADPVLYKDNFPEKLKRFNNIGSL